jgi:hypothetical protein
MNIKIYYTTNNNRIWCISRVRPNNREDKVIWHDILPMRTKVIMKLDESRRTHSTKTGVQVILQQSDREDMGS